MKAFSVTFNEDGAYIVHIRCSFMLARKQNHANSEAGQTDFGLDHDGQKLQVL